jgi:hypothetical protein
MSYSGQYNKTYMRQQSQLAKSVGFVFQFPPIQGAFDTGHGIVYIFGDLHEDEIEDIITHEILHYVVQKAAGKRASLKLDRIDDKTRPD